MVYITIKEIHEVLQKRSFKSNKGKGPRVCYPNEIIHELFGKEIMDKYWIKEE